MKFPLLRKTLAVGAVLIALTWALHTVGAIVSEREGRLHEAERSVADSLASQQVLLGPVLQDQRPGAHRLREQRRAAFGVAEFHQDPVNPARKTVEIELGFTHPVSAAELERRIALTLRANASRQGPLYWFADSAYLGSASAGKDLVWQPPVAGRYTLSAVDAQACRTRARSRSSSRRRLRRYSGNRTSFLPSLGNGYCAALSCIASSV